MTILYTPFLRQPMCWKLCALYARGRFHNHLYLLLYRIPFFQIRNRSRPHRSFPHAEDKQAHMYHDGGPQFKAPVVCFYLKTQIHTPDEF